MEENKRIVRRFSEEHHTSLENVGKVVDELLAPDFVKHVPPSPTFTVQGATSIGSQGPTGPTPTPGLSSRT